MTKSTDLENVAKAICIKQGFEFIGKTGQGAFKSTYHIRENGVPFALKVYLPGRRSEREQREIEAMQKCHHPGIARLIALEDEFDFEHERYLYLIEEFIAGGTLADWLNKNGSLDVPSTLALGSRLIDAVAHIASHKLVHRDLKPENIMLRDSLDSAVIVDFGVVRDLSATSITKTWQLRGPGTPYYAAPEQLNNEKPQQNWRTDQFSLGVVLAICVFGAHPFDATGNMALTVEAVANKQGPSNAFRQRVQSTKLFVLERMVDPWPARRYRTPEDLAKAWNEQAGA